MQVQVSNFEVCGDDDDSQTFDTKLCPTITVRAEDVEDRTFGEVVAHVDVLGDRGKARFFITVSILNGKPHALIHTKDFNGDEYHVKQKGWYQPTKRDLALRATEGMPRERMVEMLESIAIQCCDHEDCATLREAVVQSIEIGDLEMPE